MIAPPALPLFLRTAEVRELIKAHAHKEGWTQEEMERLLVRLSIATDDERRRSR